MLTVLEIIQKSTEYLDKKGISESRTNSELLLASILNCKRMDLYLQFDKPLGNEETVKMRDFLSRRGNFEPLQYITGNVEFYGNQFLVDRNVLIPRPETEILVDEAVKRISDKSVQVLDIGTGSGIIPISIAKNCLNTKLLAVDISETALGMAKENALLNETNGTVEFKHLDIFDIEKVKSLPKFDVIVSNPPYIAIEEYVTLQKEITEFEPRNALTDENDGYQFYNHISKVSEFLLNENGMLIFEAGMGQSEKIKEFMIESGLSDIEVINDFQDIPRVIIGHKR